MFIFSIILLVAIIGFFLNALVLLGLSKAFGVRDVSYAKLLLINLYCLVAGFVVALLTAFIGIIPVYLIDIIVSYFVFSYFYKKYYSVSYLKSLGIYFLNFIVFLVIGIVIVIPIRLFVVEPFVVSGVSMSPHYNQGDYLIVNRLSQNYARNDVIVFRYQTNPPEIFIKRIVGLPGENVVVANGQLSINGQQLNDPYLLGQIQGNITVNLGPDEYFVIGDNTAQSDDSRTFGAIEKSSIVGKIVEDFGGGTISNQ